ncbi:MAG: hypothetical protein R2851_01170 [Caldilineaceae bacterium]
MRWPPGVLNGIMIAYLSHSPGSAPVNSMITIALIPTFTLLLPGLREPLTVRNLTLSVSGWPASTCSSAWAAGWTRGRGAVGDRLGA